jgi:hypothetical protein
MKISTIIRKYANDYKSFNKKADGEGLKYVKFEFDNLSKDIDEIKSKASEASALNEYFDKYSQSIFKARNSISLSQSLLNEFANKYLSALHSFTKSLDKMQVLFEIKFHI